MSITVKIIETGFRQTLMITDGNSTDWTKDLIGNAGMLDIPAHDGGLEWSDRDDCYIVTQGTYDFWTTYIANTLCTKSDLATLQEDLTASRFDGATIIDEEYYAIYPSVDMEDERGKSVELIEAIRATYLNEE